MCRGQNLAKIGRWEVAEKSSRSLLLTKQEAQLSLTNRSMLAAIADKPRDAGLYSC